MVRYNIDEINDNMVLGEAVTLPSGKLLLGAGYRITSRYRDRLKEMGYQSLLIDVPGTEEVFPDTVVSERSQSELTDSTNDSGEKVAAIIDKFREEKGKNMHKMLFEQRHDLNKYIMSPIIARQLETIMQQILDQPEIVMNMAALKNSDDLIFNHAVNVTVTALCIGKKHNFSYDEFKQLATGSLNYHMGLLALPRELVHKDTALTDAEKKEIRQHTVYGYLMLAQNPKIPATSAIVALQHHELQNGKGFPLGLKGANRPPVKDISKTHVIHRFAEIVAVADTYHTLMGAEEIGDPNRTKSVVKKLIKLGGEYLNSEIVKTLVAIVPVYPVGTRVRITEAPSAQLTKYIGVVARDNPANLARPQIILYETTNHQKVTPPIIIDTAKNDCVKFELIA